MKSIILNREVPYLNYSSSADIEDSRHMTRQMSFIAGNYMLVISILGIVENLLVLCTFRRHPKLHFVSSHLVCMLCIYDIAMVVCAFPFIITSCIANRWLFSDIGCKWYGFCMTAIGLGSISTLTCIALERFLLITSMQIGTAARGHTSTRVKKMAIGSVLFGILLALLPFFGVGSYAHEPVFLSCAPAWWSKRQSDVVFVSILITFAFFVPVCLIIFSYAGICFKVYTVASRTRRNGKYIKLALVSLLMTACFLLSWGPYAVFAFLHAFGNGFAVTSMQNMIPVMMAKSCVLWNPVVYVGGNAKFRELLKADISELLNMIVDKIKISRKETTDTDNKRTTVVLSEKQFVEQKPSSTAIWVRNSNTSSKSGETVQMMIETCV